jgi:hypothetical protein
MILVCLGLVVGALLAGQPASSEQARLAECRQAVLAELGLLAGNVLDGHDVTIVDSHVTIFTGDGEVLATGKFLEGTELCHDLVKGESR